MSGITDLYIDRGTDFNATKNQKDSAYTDTTHSINRGFKFAIKTVFS